MPFPSLKRLAIEYICREMIYTLDRQASLIQPRTPPMVDLSNVPEEIALLLLDHLRQTRTLTLEVFRLFDNTNLSELKLEMEYSNAHPLFELRRDRLSLIKSDPSVITAAQQARVSDAWLPIISSIHFHSLTALDISRGYALTSKAVAEMLPSLTHLKSLVLSKAKRLNDSAFVSLTQFSNLEVLDLGATSVTKATVIAISRLTTLVSLDISSMQMNDIALGLVTATLTNLHRLVMKANTGLTDEGLQTLSRLPLLNHLDLQFTGIGAESIGALEGMVNLTWLDLSTNALVDSGCMSALQGMHGLTHLDISSTEVGDQGLAMLTHLSALRTLNMQKTWVTDKGTPYLEHLLSLEELQISFNVISDESIPSICKLESLKRLKMSFCRQISDAGMGVLSASTVGKQLELLHIGGASITSLSVPHFLLMKSLRNLALWETAILPKEAEPLEHGGLPLLAPLDTRIVSTKGTYIYKEDDNDPRLVGVRECDVGMLTKTTIPASHLAQNLVVESQGRLFVTTSKAGNAVTFSEPPPDMLQAVYQNSFSHGYNYKNTHKPNMLSMSETDKLFGVIQPHELPSVIEHLQLLRKERLVENRSHGRLFWINDREKRARTFKDPVLTCALLNSNLEASWPSLARKIQLTVQQKQDGGERFRQMFGFDLHMLDTLPLATTEPYVSNATRAEIMVYGQTRGAFLMSKLAYTESGMQYGVDVRMIRMLTSMRSCFEATMDEVYLIVEKRKQMVPLPRIETLQHITALYNVTRANLKTSVFSFVSWATERLDQQTICSTFGWVSKKCATKNNSEKCSVDLVESFVKEFSFNAQLEADFLGLTIFLLGVCSFTSHSELGRSQLKMACIALRVACKVVPEAAHVSPSFELRHLFRDGPFDPNAMDTWVSEISRMAFSEEERQSIGPELSTIADASHVANPQQNVPVDWDTYLNAQSQHGINANGLQQLANRAF